MLEVVANLATKDYINKMVLGDCVDIMKDFDDESIDICISDIPYGISYDDWDVLHNNTNSALLGQSPAQKQSKSFKTRGKPINGWSEADKKIPYEYQEWCRKWAKQLFRVTKEASPILIFSSRRYLHRVASALEDEGFLIRDIILWKKDRGNGKAQRVNNVLHRRGVYDDTYNNYRIGNLKPMYEPIIWAMKPYKHTLTDAILENKIGGFVCENDKIPSNIIEYPVNKKNEHHPTEKPVGLMKEIINLFSISDEHIILDPFAGSGSTLVACKELNKNYIGIELNTDYYTTAQERLNNLIHT